MYNISKHMTDIKNVEFFDISCSKLEEYITKKIKSCNFVRDIIQINYVSKNIWKIYKICLETLFDTHLLTEDQIFRFQKAIFEVLHRKAGFYRMKSLLLLKFSESVFGFSCWKNKILITSGKAFFRPSNAKHNTSWHEPLHEISLPLDDFSTDLPTIIMHESTHLYNFRMLGDIVGNSLKQKLTTQNFVMFALNNKGLCKLLFSSHIKENFKDMTKEVENFLEKNAMLTLTADSCKSLTDLYKFLMQNNIEIPVYNLISEWNIMNAAFKHVNKKVAELVTAAIISSRNYWENKDELLTILGITPTRVKDKTVVIFSNENENAFLNDNNEIRLSYAKYFFRKAPNTCLQKVLQSMHIKYDDIFNVLHKKMTQIAMKTYTS